MCVHVLLFSIQPRISCLSQTPSSNEDRDFTSWKPKIKISQANSTDFAMISGIEDVYL